MKTNTIILGDCVDVMAKMPAESVDMIVTSPPYDDMRTYGGFNFDFAATASQIRRILKQGGVLCWVEGDKIKHMNRSLTTFRHAIIFQELGLLAYDVIIWHKPVVVYPRANKYGTIAYRSAHEYILVMSKGSPATFNPLQVTNTHASIKHKGRKHTKPDGTFQYRDYRLKRTRTRNNVWEYPPGDVPGLNHPAMFPLNLAKDCILSWSNRDDIICDPFCGSGTTCLAARQLKRQYLGIEINADYHRMATERATGRPAGQERIL